MKIVMRLLTLFIDFNFDNLNDDEISFSSHEQGIELKALLPPPPTLNVFLGEKNRIPVLISREFTSNQELISQ